MANRDRSGEGIRLSPWIPLEHCATRVVEGTDPAVVANRRAFIEKTPRVLTGAGQWRSGPKGKGKGGSGDPRVDGTYGFDPDSRRWCDRELREMGYVLPED